jgi:hypothetical protein
MRGFFVAVTENRILSTSMRSSEVVVLDFEGREVTEWRLPQDVFPPPHWPPNRDLDRELGPGGAGEKIGRWMHGQRLLDGLVPDSSGAFLVRIHSFSGENEVFEYLVMDQAGNVRFRIPPSQTLVGAVGDGTLFWIEPSQNGYSVGRGRIRLPTDSPRK